MRARLLTAALGIVALPACAGRREGFLDPAHSIDEVAERAVVALSRGDRAGLVRLLVRQGEYKGLVFPVLPASAAAGNLDPGFAWENMQLRSLRDLGRAEEEWRQRGSPPLRLVSVRAAAVEAHGPLRVHGPLALTVCAADGPPEPLRLLGSVVERDGQFKLLAFRR